MNNKLPIEVKKDNIFTRLFNFLKSVFKKQDKETSEKENKELMNKNSDFKENNLEKLKFETMTRRNPQKVIEEIIQIIEKNPNVLENLDIEKLEIIDMYYKRKIVACKRKLKNGSVE